MKRGAQLSQTWDSQYLQIIRMKFCLKPTTTFKPTITLKPTTTTIQDGYKTVQKHLSPFVS